MSLQELYQEVIVDHSKSPRNFGKIDRASHAEGYNPLCGDKVDVYVKLDGNRVKEISFKGNGCAISTASASLMTEFAKLKTIEEVRKVSDEFQSMITHEDYEPHMDIGKLAVFQGVREFPTRVKCATLAWHTLKSALKGREEIVSTE
ncbi:MAG: SUF system NifU family Fe-S cluster assembly protein [Deltaproteobacteria bacterium]|nr:SUF system NifU family Fe-S cluster assembly protein [Deltaproteobacteria bacterium]